VLVFEQQLTTLEVFSDYKIWSKYSLRGVVTNSQKKKNWSESNF